MCASLYTAEAVNKIGTDRVSSHVDIIFLADRQHSRCKDLAVSHLIQDGASCSMIKSRVSGPEVWIKQVIHTLAMMLELRSAVILTIGQKLRNFNARCGRFLSIFARRCGGPVGATRLRTIELLLFPIAAFKYRLAPNKIACQGTRHTHRSHARTHARTVSTHSVAG